MGFVVTSDSRVKDGLFKCEQKNCPVQSATCMAELLLKGAGRLSTKKYKLTEVDTKRTENSKGMV